MGDKFNTMITKFRIFESHKDIYEICKKYNILDYVINDDMTITVYSDNYSTGNVYLTDSNSGKIPIKFKKVSGHFTCSYLNLNSMEGSPDYIGGNFYCNDNDLTSLEYLPSSALSYYLKNNKITNFYGLPEFFEKYIDLRGNPVEEILRLFNRNPMCMDLIREYDVIQGDEVIGVRLEEVYAELGEIPPIIRDLEFENYILI